MLTTALLLSLILGALLFVPMIGYIGISEIGEVALGSKGTLTHSVNATLWSTCASFGTSTVMIIIAGAVCFLMVCMVCCLHYSRWS